MAVNEPDGLVLIWNTHLRERPEFVFHSQVRDSSAIFAASMDTQLTLHLVGCNSGPIFRVSSKSDNRRHILGTSSIMGHACEVPTCLENTTFCCRPHTSCACHDDGGHTKCAQFSNCILRWIGLCLAVGYVSSTSGTLHLDSRLGKI